MNDAVFLKLAELLGQHAFADVGDLAPQFAEAADLVAQPEQDEGFPHTKTQELVKGIGAKARAGTVAEAAAAG